MVVRDSELPLLEEHVADAAERAVRGCVVGLGDEQVDITHRTKGGIPEKLLGQRQSPDRDTGEVCLAQAEQDRGEFFSQKQVAGDRTAVFPIHPFPDRFGE